MSASAANTDAPGNERVDVINSEASYQHAMLRRIGIYCLCRVSFELNELRSLNAFVNVNVTRARDFNFNCLTRLG